MTVHFTCVDGGAGVATCPADQVLTADGPDQLVSGTAIDTLGNSAFASVLVRIDQTAPTLTVSSPAASATLYVPSVEVAASFSEVLSGLSSFTCGGSAGAIGALTASCSVTLVPGANSIVITATDAAGNSTGTTLPLTYLRRPQITITAPAALTYANVTPTTVTGTVDDPTATIAVNGIAAVNVNGSFNLALPLAEGPNQITAAATAVSGAVGAASVEVTLDTAPPHVAITSPPDHFVTGDSAITIAGIINDIVVGTVNDQEAQVTVNGAAAQVANRTFVATGVPLAMGPNVIQVTGRDRVGNFATSALTVTRQVLSPAQVTLVSGNNQSAPIGAAVAAPLIVSVTDASGPVAGKGVIFKVKQNDGLLDAGGSPAPTVIATTNAQGQAQVAWTLGHRAGAGGNAVEAYAVGYDGTALFTASGTQSGAAMVVVDTNNDQVGAIGEPLPKPFIAVVTDAGHNRLGGVPVTFTVREGGGSFSGDPAATVVTDSNGRAAATLTLGMQEGNANNRVDVTFPNNPSFPAAFSASGRVPGNPAQTSVTGVVLDNTNAPIEGVSVRAILTTLFHSSPASVASAPSATTNAQGQFVIAGAPVGSIELLVDGSTAQRPGTYPSLDYELVTVAGQANDVRQPIYLLPINTSNSLCVTDTTGGGTLTIPEAPGFSLTFGPGQVTFPGGSKNGCVSVTPVHGDKVPMVPGFGQQPQFIVTIQPAGAVFNPPAAITLPNVDGLTPREVTELYSFDHDIRSFVAIGTGVVSDDGQVIRSSPGVGVLKAGWHCGGNGAQTGTAATCPVCQTCVGTTCVPDPTQNGRTCSTQNGVCRDGICRLCPVAPVTAFNPDPYGVDTQNLSTATQSSLSCLQSAAQQVGGTLTVVSGYRPPAYQTHIREVWNKYQQMSQLNELECATVKSAVLIEWNRHGLAFQPATTSNHSSGTAFDANWTLPAGTSIDALAQSCSLSRCVTGDATHFCR